MKSTESPPLWLLLLVLLAFVCFWSVVVRLLAQMSGWSALAKRFAGEAHTFRASASWASGRLGVISYRSTLHVQAGEEGLGLAVPLFFRIGHPSLLIPWQAITRCTPGKTLFIEHLELQIDGLYQPLVLYGRAARAVREASPLLKS